MKARDDRMQISKAVFVSQDDIQKLKELDKMGIELEVRLVPTDVKQNAMNLIS